MSQEERERRGFHGAAWRRRTADHARVQRTLAVLAPHAAAHSLDHVGLYFAQLGIHLVQPLLARLGALGDVLHRRLVRK